MSRSTVEHKLRSGRWLRVHQGIYLARDADPDAEQRLWVGWLAVGGYLAGLTAAAVCGLRGFPSRGVHLLIPAGSRVRHPPPGVRVHRTTHLLLADVNRIGTPPHTMAARSLVDAAAWAGTDNQARAVIAAGFQQRLVAGAEIHEVVHRLTRVRRRALILEAATDARGGAHSLPEAEFLRELRRERLPIPILQVRRRAEGGTRYLDGYYEQWRIHIEIDGSQHVEVRNYWADMRRQNALWISGDRVLRFPSWAVRHDSGTVMAQVRAALMAAGWHPR